MPVSQHKFVFAKDRQICQLSSFSFASSPKPQKHGKKRNRSLANAPPVFTFHCGKTTVSAPLNADLLADLPQIMDSLPPDDFSLHGSGHSKITFDDPPSAPAVHHPSGLKVNCPSGSFSVPISDPQVGIPLYSKLHKCIADFFQKQHPYIDKTSYIDIIRSSYGFSRSIPLWCPPKSVLLLLHHSLHVFQCFGLPIYLAYPIFPFLGSPLPNEEPFTNFFQQNTVYVYQKNTPIDFPFMKAQPSIVFLVPSFLASQFFSEIQHNNIHLIQLAHAIRGLFQNNNKLGKLKRNYSSSFDIFFWSAETPHQPLIALPYINQWHLLISKLKGQLNHAKRFFWSPYCSKNTWLALYNSLLEERKHLFELWKQEGFPCTPKNLSAWVQNVDATVNLTKLGPIPLLQFIWSKAHCSPPSVGYPTTCVYVLCNISHSKVYVGETGGKNNPRPPILRLFEHYRSALKRSKSMLRSKTWSQLLYATIYKEGIENWIMLPVQKTFPRSRLKDEAYWIRQFPHVFNLHRFWRPWHCILRDNAMHHFTGMTHQFVQKAHAFLENLREPHSLPDQLQFLMEAKVHIPKQLWLKVFHKVARRAKQTYNLSLPCSLTIPYPSGCSNLPILKNAFNDFLKKFSLSATWVAWINHIIRWVPVKGKRIIDVLKIKTHADDFTFVQNCSCQSFDTPYKYDGCIILRHFSQLSTFFSPPEVELLTQNAKDMLPMPFKKLKSIFTIAMNKLSSILQPKGFISPTFLMPLYEAQFCLYQTAISVIPTQFNEKYFTALKFRYPQFLFQTLDKNSTTILVICKSLACRLLHKVIFNPKAHTCLCKNAINIDFEKVHKSANHVALANTPFDGKSKHKYNKNDPSDQIDRNSVNLLWPGPMRHGSPFNPLAKCHCRFPSHDEASGFGAQLLYTNWLDIAPTFSAMGFHFKKSGNVPHAYILLKNKSDPHNGVIKTRIIYSYYAHPLKRLSKVIGRCLSVFIAQLCKLLPTFELCNMEAITEHFSEWGSILKSIEHDTGAPFPCRWVEFDVQDMFPSIQKNALRDALQYLYDNFVKHLQKRTRSPLSFAIHKYNKLLDEMRVSWNSDYFRLTWDNIMQFISWDLFHNNMFTAGHYLLFQINGVPIGGPLSAQLASLYCMACEHHQLTLTLQRTFTHFGKIVRFRDNLIMLLSQDFSTQEVLYFLHSIYHLNFTVEQIGQSIKTLEVFLSTLRDNNHFFLHFSLTWKSLVPQVPPREEMKSKQWVDKWSTNARFICRVYLPSAKRKCLIYAHNREQQLQNLKTLYGILKVQKYPKDWFSYVSQVYKKLNAPEKTGIG